MEKLTILYDGKCPLCYREILHYKKIDIKNLLKCIDITHPDFNISEYSMSLDEVNLKLHAIDESGNIFSGIDTFIEIWKRVPGFNIFTKITQNRFMRPVFDITYIIFAKYIRPNLPKRACDSGSCELKI